ncbi:coil containing protein [Vibrio phage 1.097.O._10N.286.49.B3]|uniref:Coil containing protein n=1 Tax=Vibrio phage 1.097.O._10N.286.49.B3 TaxID=1881383 RepID=A0A2I7R0L9_9CAUD|nr:coil containing protein [Vibrio phage 1.097.O._10N.286.49.B3]AUR87188.1 coil containing protein [Vibrio phage 1.097.O._10N.286.49.B3]
MDPEKIKHYLHTELGIPLENIEACSMFGETYIKYKKPDLDPDQKHHTTMCIVIESDSIGVLKVNPDFLSAKGSTKYPGFTKHFDRRIRQLSAEMLAIQKEHQDKQDEFVYEREVFKNKHSTLFTNYSDHLRIPASLPIQARMFWFGSSYLVDLDNEEVQLGFGDVARTVPIVAALDFLNECEVYKLLKG